MQNQRQPAKPASTSQHSSGQPIPATSVINDIQASSNTNGSSRPTRRSSIGPCNEAVVTNAHTTTTKITISGVSTVGKPP